MNTTVLISVKCGEMPNHEQLLRLESLANEYLPSGRGISNVRFNSRNYYLTADYTLLKGVDSPDYVQGLLTGILLAMRIEVI